MNIIDGFPIELVTTQSVSSNFEISFPNEDVFSVKDVRINTKHISKWTCWKYTC